MTDSRLAKLDDGGVNARILAKMAERADFRRVEAASLKYPTNLNSPEAKRMFVKCFLTVQLNVHFISMMARTRLAHEDIEKIEDALRARLEAAAKELDKGIDGAELLFKNHGIQKVATYDTVPLVLEVSVISSLSRRYFELIHKLDQVMPLLQTLEIEEVIKARTADKQRSAYKRLIIGIAVSARSFATGLRRRMNEMDAREPDSLNTGTGSLQATSQGASVEDAVAPEAAIAPQGAASHHTAANDAPVGPVDEDSASTPTATPDQAIAAQSA